MTPLELAEKLNLTILNSGDGKERQIDGVYCGDLLSIVMGRAKANDAWITVMGNVNSVAVAVLSDVSCIILSENMSFDTDSMAKAKAQQVCVLSSKMSSFDIAMKIRDVLGL